MKEKENKETEIERGQEENQEIEKESKKGEKEWKRRGIEK